MGAASVRKLRKERAAAGLCIYCGKHEPTNGATKRCPACREKQRAYDRKQRGRAKRTRERRAAEGLCVYCGKREAVEGQKRCEYCRDRDNAQHRKWLATTSASRMAAGLCKACGKRPLAKRSTSRCEACLNAESTRSPEQNERRRTYARDLYRRKRLQVLTHYSGGEPECACCGERQPAFLTIDHVNNDGNLHRKIVGVASGMKLFGYLIKNGFPPSFQVLCWNCNCGKAYYGKGVCPHKLEKQGN